MNPNVPALHPARAPVPRRKPSTFTGKRRNLLVEQLRYENSSPYVHDIKNRTKGGNFQIDP